MRRVVLSRAFIAAVCVSICCLSSCAKVQFDDLAGVEVTNSDFESSDEVDLGLSVIWAGVNLGAQHPIESGTSAFSDSGNIPEGWRIPTEDEWCELNKCTSKLVHFFDDKLQKYRNAILFTGTNGKSLLLPFAGVIAGPSTAQHDLCDNVWMRYWSSTDWVEDDSYAIAMNSHKDNKLYSEAHDKRIAASVRLVKDR